MRVAPNSSRSVRTTRPSGSWTNPPESEPWTSPMAPGTGGLAQLGHGRSRQAGLLQQLADAAGLVGADHHPPARPSRRSRRPADRAGPAAWARWRSRRRVPPASASDSDARSRRPASVAAASYGSGQSRGSSPSAASALRRSCGLVVERAGQRGQLIVVGQHQVRRRRQVIGGGGAGQQRGPRLGRLGQVALLQARQVRLQQLGQVARRALRQRAPAIGGQELAGRQQRDLLQAAPRGLRDRIEGADRLDLVAEQVQPHRFGGAGRPDVDDAAARCELADAADLDRDVVARRHQRRRAACSG